LFFPQETKNTGLFGIDPWYCEEVKQLLWLGGPLVGQIKQVFGKNDKFHKKIF
jgi:hypothetical protein